MNAGAVGWNATPMTVTTEADNCCMLRWNNKPFLTGAPLTDALHFAATSHHLILLDTDRTPRLPDGTEVVLIHEHDHTEPDDDPDVPQWTGIEWTQP